MDQFYAALWTYFALPLTGGIARNHPSPPRGGKTLRRLKLYQQTRILQTTFEQHAVNTRTMTMLSNVRTAA